MQGFVWHKDAVLIGADGALVVAPATFAAVMPDRPALVAVQAVMAGQGRAFRIGGGTDLPEADFGGFETLTGGSLGAARRIVRHQASWCASFAVNGGLFGIGPGVGVAALGRLCHSLTLYAVIEGLTLGAPVHLLDGLRPDRQARALAARGVAVLYATPAQVHGVVAAGVALPRLRHVLIGGAALAAPLRAGLQRLAPLAQVHVFYGAAETSFITLAGPACPPDCVGQPYPGVQIALRDSTGAPADEGEIWVKSPYLFQRYAGTDPGSARWHDDWLATGEVGRMGAHGLILRGRAGRMVTVADNNVFPEEIEGFLATLPGVDRVAVLPRPDAARGTVLVAVLRGDAAQQDAIMAAARGVLGPMAAPRALIWVDDWPVLASGKSDLGALAQRVAAWRS